MHELAIQRYFHYPHFLTVDKCTPNQTPQSYTCIGTGQNPQVLSITLTCHTDQGEEFCDGEWDGKLAVDGMTFGTAIHITKNENAPIHVLVAIDNPTGPIPLGGADISLAGPTLSDLTAVQGALASPIQNSVIYTPYVIVGPTNIPRSAFLQAIKKRLAMSPQK